MKWIIETILLLFIPGLLCGQYDFPVVINGLALSLEYEEDSDAVNAIVYPEYWLLPEVGDCFTDSLLISRTVFPRMNVPPPEAADSLILDCQDVPSVSVEIWWKGQAGEWLVTDSYALLAGGEQCDCTDDCTPAAVPILLNGVATAYPSSGNLMVNARQLLAREDPATTYSFTPDPGDSIRNFDCTFGGTVFVELFAHRSGLLSRSAQTYLAIATDNCPEVIYSGTPAAVIQGLGVPSGPAGMVTVPARAFAIPFGAPQQLAFSENPNDTLFSINCSSIGLGGVTVRLFNHFGGQIGPPASSYLIGDDGRRFCNSIAPPYPPNDSLENASLIDSCPTFHQFYLARVEAMEPAIDSSEGAGATVWHSFPGVIDSDTLAVRIHAIDSLFYAIYPFGAAGPTATSLMSGLLLPGTDSSLMICGIEIEAEGWLLQLQQASDQALARYYLSTELAGECTVSSVAAQLSQLPELMVYPSPNRGQFRLGGLENIDGPFSIDLFDNQGRRLRQLPAQESQQLSDLTSGLYYLRVTSARGQRTIRWLKY